ncbi:unnamed protein product [Prunus armeniaca]|uniref:Uncharacterized protein n=1 Tax=Prunus armeniaca TaxID=36596 RepID=A0A6J5U0K4_PRUAR|nr:unnamed protein product [Prunus armeniaca]
MCVLIIPFPSNLAIHGPVRRLLAKAAGAAEEQKVKINSDTKKEDKNGSCSAAGIALADGPKLGTPPEKLGKHLLQFVLPCPQLRSVADEALSFVVF